jgi:integrase
VTQYPGACGPGVAKASSVALHTYLRFRLTRFDDRVEALIAAVPDVAKWRLAALPETLSDEEIGRLLNSFSRESASSLRDYAMVRCLIDLGLRAGEVAQIQLDDLNWREGTLRIRRAKSRRTYIMPLPEATGCAIADYIRLARKATAASRSVFLRHHAPVNTPLGTGRVHQAVHAANVRDGFDQPNWKSSSSAQRRQTAASIGVVVEGSCRHTSPPKHRYDSDLYKDRSSKP